MPSPSAFHQSVTDFLEFQRIERGAIPASSAARYAGVSKPTLQTWLDRRVVKSFLHNGRYYVGWSSFVSWNEIRGLYRESEKSRRTRLTKRQKRREAENQARGIVVTP